MAQELKGEVDQAVGPVSIVVARYNQAVTTNLLKGALDTLTEHGLSDDAVHVIWVPGAWEIPLAAKRLASCGRFRAVICLGAVIRGETTHDQYINQQISQSLGRIALDTDVPVQFGVLTCDSLEQAINRSGGRVGNKGSESALAALEMADLMTKMPSAASCP